MNTFNENTYVASITRHLFLYLFVLLSFSASAQFQRGLIWEDSRYNSLPAHYGSTSALPSSRSLKLYYPRVVSQPKSDYTGVAWAAAWNARTALDALICNTTDKSKILAMSFSPSYNYGLLRKEPDCYQPISLIDLLESMTRNGTPLFSEFNDFCPSEVPRELYSMAKNRKLSGYYKLYNTNDTQSAKVRSVKNALLANNAVVAGIICPPSFQLAKDFWQPHEFKAEQSYGGHAVCVVGYDDSKFGGAFEILNTWGKDWGTQGFTWIRYKDFADYAQYGFGLFQVSNTWCDTPFRADVTFRMLSGEVMGASKFETEGQYKFWNTYPSGTTFTIEMSSNIPAYVYSFGIDAGNDQFPLFPRDQATSPVTFVALRAPDDMPALKLTDPPGQNMVYFIFSPYELDMKRCMSKLKGKKNIATSDVIAALETTEQTAKWNDKGPGFEASLRSPVVLKVLLEQTRK